MRPLAVYLVLWLAALAGFVIMAAFASAYDTFPADVWLAHRLQDIHAGAFAGALDYTEDAADVPFQYLVWLGASLAALIFIGRGQALLLLVSQSGRLLNTGLKELVERPRPSLGIVHADGQPSSFSFPSGHAQGTIVLYGLIFYLATVYVGDRRLRLPLQAACLWMIVFTGIERVYSGHHWPSDVVGGFFLGTLLLAALLAVDRLVSAARRGVTYV